MAQRSSQKKRRKIFKIIRMKTQYEELKHAIQFLLENPDKEEFINKVYHLTDQEGGDNTIETPYYWNTQNKIVEEFLESLSEECKKCSFFKFYKEPIGYEKGFVEWVSIKAQMSVLSYETFRQLYVYNGKEYSMEGLYEFWYTNIKDK
jgi:hypothetical protein